MPTVAPTEIFHCQKMLNALTVARGRPDYSLFATRKKSDLSAPSRILGASLRQSDIATGLSSEIRLPIYCNTNESNRAPVVAALQLLTAFEFPFLA